MQAMISALDEALKSIEEVLTKYITDDITRNRIMIDIVPIIGQLARDEIADVGERLQQLLDDYTRRA